jgi:hypothetical protein
MGAESCISQTQFQREVERRLAGPNLSTLQPHQHLLVRVDREGNTWVSQIEVRDAAGNFQGERTLSVLAASCKKITRYAVTVVALALEGDFGEVAESAPESVPANPEPPVPAVQPARRPEPAQSTAGAAPRVTGTGKVTLYVHAPVFSSRMGHIAPLRADLLPLQAALAARALELRPFTVVEVASPFPNEPALQSWLRKAPELAAPIASRQTSAGSEALAPADYVLLPLIETFTIRNGVDYSLGKDPRAIIVTAQITLYGFDFLSRRELPPVSFSTSLAIAGDAQNDTDARLALRIALETVAAEALEPWRDEVTGSRPPPHSGWTLAYYIHAATRLAYRQPPASDIERADLANLRVNEFGSALEFGQGVYLVHGAATEPGFRPSFDARWAFVKTEQWAETIDAQAALSRTLAVWPTPGIALVPRVGVGMLIGNNLGSEAAERAHLGFLFGATAHLAVAVEFYRRLATVSPFVALDSEYVLPLLVDPSSAEFLDSKLPRLHGISLQIGFFNRGSASAN